LELRFLKTARKLRTARQVDPVNARVRAGALYAAFRIVVNSGVVSSNYLHWLGGNNGVFLG